ncbi:hypothetical protein I546_5475 [Mycobacterium kansasii 732]|nr:hypothetical protein I546_5475 [Mycobacterium kansasii 732]
MQHRHVDLVGPPVPVRQRCMGLGLGRRDRRVFALTGARRVRIRVRRAAFGCIG